MSRLPYIADDAAGPSEVVEEIRARRGGALLNLDRMLLYSPALALGWNAHLGAVRGQLKLSPKLRELAICAVAVLNDADYEFEQHLQPFLRAGGNDASVNALRELNAGPPDASVFTPDELATLQLTQEMTLHVRVRDETFERIRKELPDNQQVVELVGVIATYNMVSRFLVALGVEMIGESASHTSAGGKA